MSCCSLVVTCTAKNTVISPDFLCGSFCGKAQFPKLCGNCGFPRNFHTRKSGEITVFFAVVDEENEQFSYTLFFI